jgi:hypothetical protein
MFVTLARYRLRALFGVREKWLAGKLERLNADERMVYAKYGFRWSVNKFGTGISLINSKKGTVEGKMWNA